MTGEMTRKEPSPTEFILLIASIQMISAFAIDAMLPALPAIGAGFGFHAGNSQQYVISAYLVGFGIAQLFVGTITDRYGRRGLLLWSLLGYALASLAATFATSFAMLILARILQGMVAAGARVVAMAIVRDKFEGRAMARVMSLSSIVFMGAPIIAPTLGQMIISVADWRWIFAMLMLFGVALFLWVLIRMPESLDPAKRIPISIAHISRTFRAIVADRQSLGYTAANTAIQTTLTSYLLSVQQIFGVTFNRAWLLPYGFAIMALAIAVGSLINSRIVMRLGMRRIGHMALIGFIVTSGAHLLLAYTGHETLESFIGLQAFVMIFFALIAGNFGAMSMENMGSFAGSATSLQGSISTIIATSIATYVGQSFDGSTVPLYTCAFAGGIVALIAVLWTEGGKLFVAHHAAT